MKKLLIAVFLILAVCFTATAGTVTEVVTLKDWYDSSSLCVIAGELTTCTNTHSWSFAEQTITKQTVTGAGSNSDLLYIIADKSDMTYSRWGESKIESFFTADMGGQSSKSDQWSQWDHSWSGTQLVSNGDLTTSGGNSLQTANSKYMGLYTWQCILSTCTYVDVAGYVNNSSVAWDSYWMMTNFGNLLGVNNENYQEIFPTASSMTISKGTWERWASVVEVKKAGGNYMLPPPPPQVAPIVSWATSSLVASADEPVPEPGTWFMGVMGLAGLIVARCCRKV